MDAYLNPQPNSGAGQPPQAEAAEVPSPSQQQQQQQQQQEQQEQQQPAPSGTSDVAGAGAGKHAKTSHVWLYYREIPVVTEGGKNMKMPPVANSHDFDLLNAWKSYATDGVDAKTGKVVTPARLPHIGLLARLHLGIDATSCQAERNFSALSALLGDLQSNLGRRKVEMMMLLKLNQ